MLVLSRKPGEKVFIGGDITFTILEAKRNRVRIGIEAPAQILIVRQELCDSLEESRFSTKRKRREGFHAATHA
jgi:carbon storage regulator